MVLNSKIVILGAGQSSRMKQPKALLPFFGKTLLEFQIDSVAKMGLVPLLVLGNQVEEIRNTIRDLDSRAEVILNPHPNRGQFSSLKLALKKTGNSSVFVLPLDTPAPEENLWIILEEHLRGHDCVVPNFKHRGGHPVLLSSVFCRALCSQEIPEDEQRLDLQIKKLNKNRYLSVQCELSSILVDLDTPAEYEDYFKKDLPFNHK